MLQITFQQLFPGFVTIVILLGYIGMSIRHINIHKKNIYVYILYESCGLGLTWSELTCTARGRDEEVPHRLPSFLPYRYSTYIVNGKPDKCQSPINVMELLTLLLFFRYLFRILFRIYPVHVLRNLVR